MIRPRRPDRALIARGSLSHLGEPRAQIPFDSPRPLLSVSGLTCTFGGTVAVRDATLEVPQGSVTAVVGPNGAGKSTVLKAICGAVRPTSGEILLDAVDITSWPTHRIARAGVTRTFQLAGQFGHLTVLENVLVAAPSSECSFWSALRPRRHWVRAERTDVEAAKEMLREVGLGEKLNDYAVELSGGQRRLLELVRCMTTEPRLLLLDEPASGVSPPTIKLMVRMLKKAQQRGVTIVIVEHQFSVIEALADRVVVMAEGEVLTTSSPSEVASDPAVQKVYLVG